jgi:hypothetical protein
MHEHPLEQVNILVVSRYPHHENNHKALRIRYTSIPSLPENPLSRACSQAARRSLPFGVANTDEPINYSARAKNILPMDKVLILIFLLSTLTN